MLAAKQHNFIQEQTNAVVRTVGICLDVMADSGPRQAGIGLAIIAAHMVGEKPCLGYNQEIDQGSMDYLIIAYHGPLSALLCSTPRSQTVIGTLPENRLPCALIFSSASSVSRIRSTADGDSRLHGCGHLAKSSQGFSRCSLR
jgi:hypothetical protein